MARAQAGGGRPGGRGVPERARAATAAVVTRATMQTASKDVDARALCADAANAVRVWPRAARSAAAPLPAWARLVKKKCAGARARAVRTCAGACAARERARACLGAAWIARGRCLPSAPAPLATCADGCLALFPVARARARARSRRFPHNCKLPKIPAMRL